MSETRRDRRRGFTMIELIVVAGLASLLMAITVPAIERARQAARRASCKNNLKMIGIALRNYHDAHKTFPPGWVAKDANAKTHGFYSWQVCLLPFLEQAPLYTQIDFSKRFGKPNDITKTKLAVYRCPDDKSSDLNSVRGGYATSNYSGNYGSTLVPGSADALKKSNGIFWWNSSTRIRDILDGTSNTLAVGERSVRSAAGIWAGARTNQNENDVVTDCNHQSRMNAVIGSFSSMHKGGANFLYCDGAVRFLKETIDSKKKLAPPQGLYQRLSERADSQVSCEF